ncbi:MAG: DUF6152 family protein [Pseudomonadota bacterium]
MNIRHTIPGVVLAAAGLIAAGAAQAHHGTGLFEVDKDVEYSGTLTEMELVNPHSYMHFEVAGPDGQPFAMRCEMRAAMLIRRSGWSAEMFVPGAHVQIKGHPHRTDPHACYLESFTLNEAEEIGRNDQLSSTNGPVNNSDRPLRLASGEPNISGDWAVEQAVLTAPPGGGRGDMIPRSQMEAYSAGKITLAEIRAINPTPRPVYTEAGKAAADKFEMWSVKDNPRLSCMPTSVIYDWTFDWPVNRITQTTSQSGEKVIILDYGLYTFTRTVHMDMDGHPADLEPSQFGHSIGKWEGDTLVVDSIGFEAGVLSPPTLSSEQLHIVERFTLDPKTMSIHREYSAVDPVYLAGPYEGADTVFISETPFMMEGCKEMTPEFMNQAQ